jgi:hypothetical protein
MRQHTCRWSIGQDSKRLKPVEHIINSIHSSLHAKVCVGNGDQKTLVVSTLMLVSSTLKRSLSRDKRIHSARHHLLQRSSIQSGQPRQRDSTKDIERCAIIFKSRMQHHQDPSSIRMPDARPCRGRGTTITIRNAPGGSGSRS